MKSTVDNYEKKTQKKHTLYIIYIDILFFLHTCPLLIPLYNTAVLIKICRFLINVVKFNTKHLRNWTFQRFAMAALRQIYNVDSKTTYFNENCCNIYRYVYQLVDYH